MYFRFITLLFISLFLTDVALAEKTYGIYGGYSDTGNSDVTINRYYFIGAPDTYREPINGNSGLLGVRVVRWLDAEDKEWIDPEGTFKEGQDISWLGFSADLFAFQAKGDNTKAFTTALALDMLLRYPHDTLQPYMGMGMLFHITKVSVSEQSSYGESTSSWGGDMGIDFRTGLSWLVNSDFSLFAEYRFTSVSFSQDKDDIYFSGDTISTSLRTNHYLIGIAFSH